MKNGISWATERAAEAKRLRNEIFWSIFSLMLLAGFSWLFLNPQVIVRLYLG